jgi:hypothetical protein
MQADKPKGVAREAQRYELTGVPTSTDLQNAGLAPEAASSWSLNSRSDSRCAGLREAGKLNGCELTHFMLPTLSREERRHRNRGSKS